MSRVFAIVYFLENGPMTDGERLLEIAHEAWDERRGEFRGPRFASAVRIAMRNLRGEFAKKKDRRPEAVKLVTATFSQALLEDAETADCICREAAGESGQEMQAFAARVRESLREMDAVGDGPPVYGAIDIAMIISFITAIVQAVQACRRPQPTPTPTPA